MTDSLKIGAKLAPYNPTNMGAVDIAIELLAITSNDVVYDLGCGDARFLVRVRMFAILFLRRGVRLKQCHTASGMSAKSVDTRHWS